MVTVSTSNVSHNSINRLVFVMVSKYVAREAEFKFSYMIHINTTVRRVKTIIIDLLVSLRQQSKNNIKVSFYACRCVIMTTVISSMT